jgi:hypothetical protein
MSSFLQDADAGSSCTPSVTAESAAASRTSAHNKGKKTSPVWAHTCEPLEHENQELLYCSYCELNDKPHGAKTASSMTKHIHSMHKTVIIELGVSKSQEVVRQQLKSIYR